MSNYLQIEKNKTVWTVIFNRPEMRSPLSVDVIKSVISIVDDANILDENRKLIFTGRDGVFASGANLREIADVNGNDARAFAELGQAMTDGIASLSCKTISAIDGFCYGGALDLALACKIRIASKSSQFAHPGANLGIMTGWGGTQRLPRLIGQARAFEMFFTAEPLVAVTAKKYGLIDHLSEEPLRFAIEL